MACPPPPKRRKGPVSCSFPTSSTWKIRCSACLVAVFFVKHQGHVKARHCIERLPRDVWRDDEPAEKRSCVSVYNRKRQKKSQCTHELTDLFDCPPNTFKCGSCVLAPNWRLSSGRNQAARAFCVIPRSRSISLRTEDKSSSRLTAAITSSAWASGSTPLA